MDVSALIVATVLVSVPNEAPVARLVHVEGNVLVAHGRNMVSAAEGTALGEGWRVFATTGAKAVVEFAHDCRITLRPGERLVVDRAASCKS
ncbi:MAG TPA: hypothetical protein VM051_00090 [Usitatibacter sp.]|nr:hypothetical protein [Usitatibacter sp.]